MSRLRRPDERGLSFDDDGDRREVRALADAGAILGRERSVQHYLVVPARHAAATASLQLADAGFDTAIIENPTAAGWIVVAERFEALDEETVPLSRSLLELIAERCGAEYDGWRTELLPDEAADQRHATS